MGVCVQGEIYMESSTPQTCPGSPPYNGAVKLGCVACREMHHPTLQIILLGWREENDLTTGPDGKASEVLDQAL